MCTVTSARFVQLISYLTLNALSHDGAHYFGRRAFDAVKSVDQMMYNLFYVIVKRFIRVCENHSVLWVFWPLLYFSKPI